MAWQSTGLNIKGPKGDEGPQGPKGDDGTSVKIIDNVANASQLPSSGVEAGDGYITDDTGHLWVWSGTEWTDVGNITGPEGPEGPEGPKGDNGADGRGVTSGSVNGDGDLVLTYTDSQTQNVGHVKGAKGEQGTSGTKGDDGEPGPAGEDGEDGRGITSASVNGSGNLVLTYTDEQTQDVGHVKGDKGDTGSKGETGTSGQKGDTGDTGQRGSIWNAGSGAPGTISGTIIGDMYIDGASGDIWRFDP